MLWGLSPFYLLRFEANLLFSRKIQRAGDFNSYLEGPSSGRVESFLRLLTEGDKLTSVLSLQDGS